MLDNTSGPLYFQYSEATCGLRLPSRVLKHVCNSNRPQNIPPTVSPYPKAAVTCAPNPTSCGSQLGTSSPSLPSFCLALTICLALTTPHMQVLSLLCPQITSEVCPAGLIHPLLAPGPTVGAFLPD